MNTGLVLLCLAYVLSQFFRAFLAVLAAPLHADTGAGAEVLAVASGMWFLSFALMQLPVGWALDRIGPRRTASALLLVGGGGGAALFSVATTPFHIHAAMLLIGVGCAPVLMASYYIFAREYPPARFATLAALMLGVGSAGNLMASYPTALAAEWVGWRGTLAGLSAVSALVAVGVFVTVRDPAPVEGEGKASVLSLLKMPVLWLILPIMLVNYIPAGSLRGLWMGPYLHDVFGFDTAQVGQATLMMGVAMIVGTLSYGPMDRIFGSRKWPVVCGGLGSVAALVGLVFLTGHNPVPSVALCALIGVFGGYFPVLIAHGRAFFPAHLMGRGVTLMNLFGIGGVGLGQLVTGRVHAHYADAPVTQAYSAIFAVLACALLIGVVIYMFSRDSVN